LQATLAIATALALVLELTADIGVRLVYGAAFAEGVTALRLLLPGTVLYVATGVLCSGLLSVTRPLTAAVAQLPGIVVTATGLVLFLRSGGITAAALISSASYAITFATTLVLYRHATGLVWREFLPRSATWRPAEAAELQVKLLHG
jgi:O-antigen/teichoic acid export membrane protein